MKKILDFLSANQSNKWHVFFAIFLVFAFWLVYGLGQISGSLFAESDNRETSGALPYAKLVSISESGQMSGKLVIKDKIRLFDQHGNVWEIPDFKDNISTTKMADFRSKGLIIEGDIKIVLQQHTPAAGQVAFGNFMDMLGRVAVTAFYILFIALILQQAKVSGSGFFNKPFKKISKENTPLPSFKDVAGHSGPKREIEEIVDYLKDSARFLKAGAKPPRGILLYGPPGNGKTMLAKAVAGEANASFLEQNASSFVQMFAGMGAMRVRDLFRTAREQKPCVIFIDEIDAIGLSRDSGGAHEERIQTINAFLSELDGFENNDGIVVIAATNRLPLLDEALVRPGRFDRKVLVPLPAKNDRLAILGVHAAKLPACSVNLEKWATKTHGFSGADLANLVNEAAMEAARSSRSEVLDEDFSMAKDRILMGPRNLGSSMSEEERKSVAYHEAGHAILRILSGRWKLDKVSILPRGNALGVTIAGSDGDGEGFLTTKNDIEKELYILMGGRVAESLFCSDITNGAADDIEKASKLARLAVSKFGFDLSGPYSPERPDQSDHVDKLASEWVQNAHATAREFLKKYSEAVHAVAYHLLENDEVEGTEVVQIFNDLNNDTSV